ncbi:hypothetical protein, partial [Achromobacter xylosoxidans]|uniref:hypothetical protein n=1 Tax=Alcaligenes xylosoxydans xylosoxydans TaxID=85698 RepID=UPI001F136984
AAILLLTEEADSISDCHTRTPGDWAGEPEAKAHYDHVQAVVDALSKLRAPVAEDDEVKRIRDRGPAYPYTPNTAPPTPLASAPVAGEAIQKAKHDTAHAETERERVTALAYWLDQQTFEPGMLSCAAATLRAMLGRDAAPQASAEDVRNAALEEAAAWVDKRRHDFDHEHGYMEPGTGAWSFGTGAHATAKAEYSAELDEIAEGIRALKQPQADKDGGQQRAGDGKTREAGDYTRGGALNFDDPAPAGPEGIRSQFNACMHRNECRAMLDRQPKLRADASAVRRALIAASNYIDTLGGDSKSYRAALYAPQAEQGERDAD